ncbi:hypothetical protein K1719_042984 [Acacia pycnantha]|nr:hypothetical protein K1719_042984 [Acacia pycnantha]
MLHPVPFEGNLKNDPPPHPGEDQSSKRAKIDEGQVSEDCMEAEQSLDLGSIDSHVSATFSIPSFKDKLLNVDNAPTDEEEDDIVLNQGDVSIGLHGKIPIVDFASHVIETLNKKMGLTVVVKLLGRKIGFLERLVFVTFVRSSVSMETLGSQDHVVNQVIGWIRLPKLLARYYHKSIIRSIGGVFGEVFKVDYNTDSGDHGKFARIAVVIDLTKPLISKIQVDGELIFVEYGGLPSICFNCGLYGHLQDSCSAKMVADARVSTVSSPSSEPNVPC